jgi:hypothetical protein
MPEQRIAFTALDMAAEQRSLVRAPAPQSNRGSPPTRKANSTGRLVVAPARLAGHLIVGGAMAPTRLVRSMHSASFPC